MAGKNLFSWENHPVKKVALTRRRWSLRRLERPRPVGNGEGPAGRAVVALPASLQLLLQVSQGCVIWGNHRKGLSDTRQRKGTKPGGSFCTVLLPWMSPTPRTIYPLCQMFTSLSPFPTFISIATDKKAARVWFQGYWSPRYNGSFSEADFSNWYQSNRDMQPREGSSCSVPCSSFLNTEVPSEDQAAFLAQNCFHAREKPVRIAHSSHLCFPALFRNRNTCLNMTALDCTFTDQTTAFSSHLSPSDSWRRGAGIACSPSRLHWGFSHLPPLPSHADMVPRAINP